MAAVETADANPDVRVTVITGAGEKTFCSGYDLGSIPASGQKPESNNGTGHKDSAFENVMDRIEAMRMPTLCALNGGVYGGATDMALACDFRLGVKGMKFFMPAARFGLHYYPSGLRRYTQKVSPSFAKRAFLLSEDFSRRRPAGCGLSRLAGGTKRVQGKNRRDIQPACHFGAAFHGEHEACHRAVRPGRTRRPGNPSEHARVRHIRRPPRRPGRPA